MDFYCQFFYIYIYIFFFSFWYISSLTALGCFFSSSWLPEHVTLLARFAGEPTPVKSTVTKAVAEFRRTHADTWNVQKNSFTEEQLEVALRKYYFSKNSSLVLKKKKKKKNFNSVSWNYFSSWLLAGSGWYILFIFIFCLTYIVFLVRAKI